VAFQVVEHFEGDSARGDYIGEYPGVIRPVVDWTTHFQASEEASEVLLREMTTARRG